MIQQIINFFQDKDFDIRKTNNARFMDQKVTVDVLCIISDCVLQYVKNKDILNTEFNSTDIWKFEYSNENVQDVFGKTDVNNKNVKNEYDKFFQQPLKTLSYANILNEKKYGNKIYFSINNIDILEYISIKERNSLEFLNLYLKKILEDSDIWNIFSNFFTYNTKDNFDILKEEYEKFIIEYTPINGKTEVRRIFYKSYQSIKF